MDGRVMKKRGGKENVPAGNTALLKSRIPMGEGDPLILLAESRALDHVWALLHDATVPEIPEGLEGILPLQSIHRELCEIRETMKRYTVWDIEISLESRGILPGYLKALRSNLRHLIWRMQMVTEGDATPQENSIGKFSGVFDGLIRRMEGLREKEAELCALRGENADGKRTGASPPQMCRPGDAPYRAGGRGGLAGALDREAFIFRAFDDLYAAFAQGKWCCLAVVEPDQFEDFSDRYGRLAGDEALEHAAQVFGTHLRKMDFMGRWGGERFAFFFQNMDISACCGVCERILQMLTFTPFNLGEEPVYITASIGVTAVDPDEFSINAENFRFPVDNAEMIEKLVGRAEKALHEAKKTGCRHVGSVYSS